MYNEWKSRVLGKPLDIDGWYGDQCVDVIMDYVQFLYPGEKWQDLIGVTGSAKNIFGTANAGRFEKLQGIIPRQGDIVVYNATSGNPDGHIAVVDRADANTITTVEQNGFHPTGVTYMETRNYNNVIGYLRPKGLNDMTRIPEDSETIDAKKFITGDPNYQPTGPEFDYYKQVDQNGIPIHGDHQLFYDIIGGGNARLAQKDAVIADLQNQLAQKPSTGGTDQQTKDDISFIKATVQWIKDKLSSVFK